MPHDTADPRACHERRIDSRWRARLTCIEPSEHMNRNMITRRVGSMLAIRQNKNEATDKDWSELQAELRAHQEELDHTTILVYTDGGTLTAPQRKELMAVLGDSHALVAAVSDSMKVRFA